MINQALVTIPPVVELVIDEPMQGVTPINVNNVFTAKRRAIMVESQPPL